MLYDNKPVEEYQYDRNGNQIERKIINKSNTPEYFRFAYRNSLKINSQYFVSDTIIGTDTLIYEKNSRNIEPISHYQQGKMSDTVIKRNNEGQIIEKKWREYYQSYSDSPFYNVNKNTYTIMDDYLKSNIILTIN